MVILVDGNPEYYLGQGRQKTKRAQKAVLRMGEELNQARKIVLRKIKLRTVSKFMTWEVAMN